MVRHGRASRICAVGAAVFALLATLPAVAPATEAVPEFCTATVLRDYTAPLARLPKLRRPAQSGRLPFGPTRLSFHALGDFGEARGAEGGLVRTGEGIHYSTMPST